MPSTRYPNGPAAGTEKGSTATRLADGGAETLERPKVSQPSRGRHGQRQERCDRRDLLGAAAGDPGHRHRYRGDGRGRRVRQRAREVPRGGESVCRVPGECLVNDLLERLGHVAHRPERRWRCHEALRDHRLGRGAGEGRLAGEHLVHHAAETVDIGPAVEPGATHRLLRTHVSHGAHRQSRLGQAVLVRRIRRQGDPEVRHHRLASEEQDVLRLDVPVHHAVGMGEVERLGDAPADTYGLVQRKRSLAPDALPQAFAIDHRHSVPQEAVGLAGVVHCEDMGMPKPGGHPNLAEETLAQLGAELGMEHLEGDRAVVPQVVGEVDRGHAAPAQLTLHAISVPERGLETAEDVGRHGIPGRKSSCNGTATPAPSIAAELRRGRTRQEAPLSLHSPHTHRGAISLCVASCDKPLQRQAAPATLTPVWRLQCGSAFLVSWESSPRSRSSSPALRLAPTMPT